MRPPIRATIAALALFGAMLTAGIAAAQVTFTASYVPATLPSGGGFSSTELRLTNNSGSPITGGAFTYVYPANLAYNTVILNGCGVFDVTGSSLTQVQVANINLANGATCLITTSGSVTVSGTYPLAASSVSYAGAAGSPVALTPGANPTLVVAAPPAPVPTLSEWAMILFATLLAGGAAVCIQRRRQDI